MIYIIFSILSICNAQQSFDYNNWILAPSTEKFPQESAYHAVGYSNQTNTFWLLGANAYPRQLISFKDNVITDHGQSNLSENIYGTAQFYAQTANILWMINNAGTSFIKFNVNTLEIDYKYNNITFPYAVSSFSALAATSEYLFVLGRRVGNTHYNTVQMFDLINNVWIMDVPFMTTPRSYAASVIHDGFLYAIGGYYFVSPDSWYLNTIERLYINNASFISSYSWDVVGNLSIGRYGLRAVTYGSDIIVIGGYMGLYDYITVVDVIDTATDPLQVRHAGDLPRAAAYPAVIQVDSTIYVFGGRWVWGGPTYIVQNSDRYQYTAITTFAPTNNATTDPTPAPTTNPTPAPTSDPTPAPTMDPTPAPTSNPTPAPTTDPTPSPTTDPTPAPTTNPTPAPTMDPTSASTTIHYSTTKLPSSDPTTSQPSLDPVDESGGFQHGQWAVISWIPYFLCVLIWLL